MNENGGGEDMHDGDSDDTNVMVGRRVTKEVRRTIHWGLRLTCPAHPSCDRHRAGNKWLPEFGANCQRTTWQRLGARATRSTKRGNLHLLRFALVWTAGSQTFSTNVACDGDFPWSASFTAECLANKRGCHFSFGQFRPRDALLRVPFCSRNVS